jgi:pullulanase/glycogen debranching enzyme
VIRLIVAAGRLPSRAKRRDCVCFNQKHNQANGEENRDGTNNNYSNNHGIEASRAKRSLEAAKRWAKSPNDTFCCNQKRRAVSRKWSFHSVMGRTPEFRQDAPLFEAIRRDPVLSALKLIAEPWERRHCRAYSTTPG